MISVSRGKKKATAFVDSGAISLLCAQVSCMHRISKLSFSQKLVTLVNSKFFVTFLPYLHGVLVYYFPRVVFTLISNVSRPMVV